MSHVTKSVFLSSRHCPTRGWFLRNLDRTAQASDGDLFRLEQGIEIGRLARTLYPTGTLISGPNLDTMATATKQLIATGQTLFEATFLVDDFVAKADVIQPHGSDWHVIEVKSSLADTDQLDAYTDDLSYTVMVAQRSGLRVTKASLILISRTYRKGMPVTQLFVEVDRTYELQERLPEFAMMWDEVHDATTGTERPLAALNGLCRNCEFFDSECLGRDIANPLHQLPRISGDIVTELGSQGIRRIDDVHDDVQLSEIQRRVRDCVRTGTPYVGNSLRDELARVHWPAYYLDFESVMTVLPLYPGIAPFEQVLTQFSIHRCSALGQIDDHSEFLADHACDCRRELAERLIADLGEEGSIIVYSPFELSRINELAALFPDLRQRLAALAERIFDLLPIIRGGYYDAEFYGSFSIKSVLPVLVPQLSYASLAIGDGDAAISHFARLALNQYADVETAQIRKSLLEYCKLDTLAMVRLHEQLWQRAVGAAADE